MLRVHEGGGRAVRRLNLGPDASAEGIELLASHLAEGPAYAVNLLEILIDALAEVRDKARHRNPRSERREYAPRVMVAVVHPCLVVVGGMSHQLLLPLEDGDVMPASSEKPGNIEAEDAASDNSDSLSQFTYIMLKTAKFPRRKTSKPLASNPKSQIKHRLRTAGIRRN